MKKHFLTLVELAMVVVILVLLAAAVSPRIVVAVRNKLNTVRTENIGRPDTLESLEERMTVSVIGTLVVESGNYALIINTNRRAVMREAKFYSLPKDNIVKADELYKVRKEFILKPDRNGVCPSRMVLVPYTTDPDGHQ